MGIGSKGCDGSSVLPPGSRVIIPPTGLGECFTSGLHSRWARFMTLAGWQWQYQPGTWFDWSPDFRASFSCGHSECGRHTLLVTVLPLSCIDDFQGHACTRFTYGGTSAIGIPADA